MNMFLEACLAAALLGLAADIKAAPRIELKDGSRIEGDIQGMESGVYTVVSPSIGTVHIAQSNIAQIVYGGDALHPADSSGKSASHVDALAGEVEQLKARLAQDPAAMQSITSLQSDPQIQALLSDPAIMKAIEEGDYTSLLGNTKIQALETNEHVKQLLLQQAH